MTILLTSLAYGRRVGLAIGDADTAAVRPLLPFWWTDDNVEPERIWELASSAAEPVIREMELWVAEHAVGVVFVHAGAVAIAGRALLLPGRSMTGKTTLTAELLRTGADYLSDEYAVVDAGGRVHPYPRPLSVRRADGGRDRVSAASLGAGTIESSLEVALVASLVHEPGGGFEVEPVSRAAATLQLLDNTVSAKVAPERALDAIVALLASAQTVAGRRGHAADAAGKLIALTPSE